jgi:hypothetical protein
VTLAVMVDTISGRVLRRHRMSVLKWHRLALTGSRWYTRFVSGRVKTPAFSVISVFSLAVMERCYDCSGGVE